MLKLRWSLAAALVIPISAWLPLSLATASVYLINDQGATAPCIGIGPIGGPAAEYCGTLFEENGFLRVTDAGVSGLTLGEGEQDGVIIAVEPGSGGANAGLLAGDVIIQINGDQVIANPGAFAAQHLFGRRNEKMKVRIRRDSTELDLILPRTPTMVERAPTSTNPLVSIKPLVDWRGKFIPCIGIGPLGFAAIGFCISHFKPFGYVPVQDAGGSGFAMDTTRTDKAIVGVVDPNAKAANLIRSGDEVLAIDGVQVLGSRTAVTNAALFGKAGVEKRLVVTRRGSSIASALILLGRAK